MVKYILALSLVAATVRAVVAGGDAETTQKGEQQSRRGLEAGAPTNLPTYWPTYFPTYFPTEEFEQTEDADGEKAAGGGEVVKETRNGYIPPPPDGPPPGYGPPSGYNGNSDGSSERPLRPNGPPPGYYDNPKLPPPPPPIDSKPETDSWDVAPMWDDDGWEGVSAGKASKWSKAGKGSSWKCSKAGKVSCFNIF